MNGEVSPVLHISNADESSAVNVLLAATLNSTRSFAQLQVRCLIDRVVGCDTGYKAGHKALMPGVNRDCDCLRGAVN